MSLAHHPSASRDHRLDPKPSAYTSSARPTAPLPTPPLSVASSSSPVPSSAFDCDPWIEEFDHSLVDPIANFSRLRENLRVRMDKTDHGLAGLEGSWRMDDMDRPHVVPSYPAALPPFQPEAPAGPSRREVKRPMPTKVWAELMDTSKGRDKVLKCVQYSLRTYLYLLGLLAAVRPLSPWFLANQRRMKTAVSGLSLTRKCLLLLNPLHPLTDLLSPEPMSATKMLSHLIDLCSAVSDDIYCLFKLGILGKRVGRRADQWANRFWLLTTLIGLYKLHLKTIPSIRRRIASTASASVISSPTVPTRRCRPEDPVSPERDPEWLKWRKELVDAEWTNRKLLADLIFVSYDVFRLKWLAEPVQTMAGLVAALIATNKLYDKHWQAGLGK